MNSEPKEVSIELQTVINDDGQTEYNTVKENGNFYKKDNIDVLTFKEKADDGSLINNLITIHADKVSIKRIGSVKMHQQFRLRQTSENVFQHEYGHIHMETFTNSMQYQELADQQNGLLKLDYTVKLNGQEERKQKITLSIKEEDSQ
ncbi:DUF1934 domain-containing protein [Virgibacillus litoralis]|uniref:Uncharacterized beta-barrel protein YwiB (DUF1934 family) n=1 Tax=Virgibacillus litoralis TaxID=578221 RepID=A0ABS4HDG7_9BACI|nr:DUF1934 domain-containing protein [Virgibacillus litoralis]MBP1948893.1 uncharacterized beta-barrel protein YwiB (DUF1934 family) [Virgibacillus litoralis]